ncbi:hypothetical protein [Streptomyces sp. NPDC001297]|uniref:hypothetical protein n=1 Tax=Streptomyces sp. NPDC001297 TaxID=3364559 RepID=UPI0036C3AA74
MIFLYAVAGVVVSLSYDVMPTDGLSDLQTDPSRCPTRGELAAAVALWCLAVAVWPLMVAARALAAARARRDPQQCEPRTEPGADVPGQRRAVEEARPHR